MRDLLTRPNLSPPACGGSAAAGGEGGLRDNSPLRTLRGHLPRARGRKTVAGCSP